MSGASVRLHLATPYANAATVNELPRLVAIGRTPMSTWPDRAVESAPVNARRRSDGYATMDTNDLVMTDQANAEARFEVVNIAVNSVHRKTGAAARLGAPVYAGLDDAVIRTVANRPRWARAVS